MKLIRKFLHLPSIKRRLLVKAALLLAASRIGLYLLPFSVLQGLIARVSAVPTGLGTSHRSSMGWLVWAVAVVARYMPRATCLSQALATQVFLARHGYPAYLCMGVAKGKGGRLEAHAWVESQGRVIIGGSELGRYTRLLALQKERQ